eukprot:g5200.t1
MIVSRTPVGVLPAAMLLLTLLPDSIPATTPRLPPRPLPSFSWDTVPVFFETSNVTGPFDDSSVRTMARAGLVVLEKAYNFPAPGFAEDKLLGVLADLRRARPASRPAQTIVFYYNSNLDCPDYRLHAQMAAHAPGWWVRGAATNQTIREHQDSGAGAQPPFPYPYTYVFEHRRADVRGAWVAECTNMTAHGFDGCMVDRWGRTPKAFKGQLGAAEVAQWVAGRDNATAALAAAMRRRGRWLVASNGLQPAADATSDPGFQGKPAAVAEQQQAAAAGKGFLASARPGTWRLPASELARQLAGFLVAAGVNHFFGGGSWTVNATEREGVHWYPEYDRPLGAPLGPASLNGTVLTRRFASGTTARFDTRSGEGSIAWATRG